MCGCEGGFTLVEQGPLLYLHGQQPPCFGSEVMNYEPHSRHQGRVGSIRSDIAFFLIHAGLAVGSNRGRLDIGTCKKILFAIF